MPDNDNIPFGWGNDEDEDDSQWIYDEEEENSPWGSDDGESAWESDDSDSAWSTQEETEPARNDADVNTGNENTVSASTACETEIDEKTYEAMKGEVSEVSSHNPERDEVYAAMLRSVQSSAKRKKIIKGVLITLSVAVLLALIGLFVVKFITKLKEENDSHDNSYSIIMHVTENTEENITETTAAVTTVTTVPATTVTTVSTTTTTAVTSSAIDYEKIDEAYNNVLSDFMNSDDYMSYKDFGTMCSMYEMYDINSDGIKELFISESSSHSSRVFIYTYTDLECKKLLEIPFTWGEIAVNSDNSFIVNADLNMGHNTQSIYEFNGNTIDLKDFFTENSMNADYETVVYKHNNQEVTKTEYITAMSAYDYLELIVVGRLNYFEENNEEPTDDTNTESPVKIYKDSFCYGMVHVESGGLNLRSEPNTDCKVLEIIPNNTKLNIYYTEYENWYYTSYNEKSGYVSAEFISFDFENYSDQEDEVYTEELPVKIHTDVDFPMEFSNYVDGEILCTYKITGVRYNCERIKNTNSYDIKLYFSGEKTYSRYNDYVNDTVRIKYQIFDSEGKEVDIFAAWYDTPELTVGGTFTNDEEDIYDSLTEGEYTLVLS